MFELKRLVAALGLILIVAGQTLALPAYGHGQAISGEQAIA